MAILLHWVLPEDHFLNYLIVYLWKNADHPDRFASRGKVMNRFMHVLNNSYYSSKYGKGGTYSNGCRKQPSPAEVDEFLTDFTMNSNRFSIDNKLESYGSRIVDEERSLSSQGASLTPTAVTRSSSHRSSVIIAGSGTMRKKPALPAAPAPPPPVARKETALVLYDITLDINPDVLVCKEGDGLCCCLE